MTFNGPDDANRISTDADREIAKLKKLLKTQIALRDAADAYVADWRAKIRADVDADAVDVSADPIEPPPVPPVDLGTYAPTYANGSEA